MRHVTMILRFAIAMSGAIFALVLLILPMKK